MSLNSFRLTHEVPVSLSHRKQFIDLRNANQLTGFYMRATLAPNGLIVNINSGVKEALIFISNTDIV